MLDLYQSPKVANKVVVIWYPSWNRLRVMWGLKKNHPDLVGSVEPPGLGICGELQCCTLE